MELPFRAVIFDMDGVLIDSEPFWKQAECQVFSAIGADVSDAVQELTAGWTTKQVARFWLKRSNRWDIVPETLEQAVIDRVLQMIVSRGKARPGIPEIIEEIKQCGCKIGLASNSPCVLIDEVLKQLHIGNLFDHIASAEHVSQGKPAPDIYCYAADGLGVLPRECLVFEDSVTGGRAALRAGIKVVGVTPEPQLWDAIKGSVQLLIPSFEMLAIEDLAKGSS